MNLFTHNRTIGHSDSVQFNQQDHLESVGGSLQDKNRLTRKNGKDPIRKYVVSAPYQLSTLPSSKFLNVLQSETSDPKICCTRSNSLNHPTANINSCVQKCVPFNAEKTGKQKHFLEQAKNLEKCMGKELKIILERIDTVKVINSRNDRRRPSESHHNSFGCHTSHDDESLAMASECFQNVLNCKIKLENNIVFKEEAEAMSHHKNLLIDNVTHQEETDTKDFDCSDTQFLTTAVKLETGGGGKNAIFKTVVGFCTNFAKVEENIMSVHETGKETVLGLYQHVNSESFLTVSTNSENIHIGNYEKGESTEIKPNIKPKSTRAKNEKSKLQLPSACPEMVHEMQTLMHRDKIPFEETLSRSVNSTPTLIPGDGRDNLIVTRTQQKNYTHSQFNKNLPIKRYLTRHRSENSNEEPFKCSHCNAQKSIGSNPITQMRTQTGEKPYQCSYCNAKSSIKSDLAKHINTHTGENRFQCSYCNKKFPHKSNLTVHIRIHTGEKPYRCSYCNAKSSTKSNLAKHIRTHTGEKPYQCSHCNATFSRKSVLAMHIRTHTGEKPYQCSYCNKKFTQNSGLTAHIRRHTGKKPYRCSYCNAKSSYKSHLAQHIRTHTGEKPYECSYCNKTFSHKSNLTVHIRTHTGEKLYQCSYCNKKFTQKSGLTAHIRRHTGKKPYRCSYCNAKSSTESDLAKHIRTHTGEKPYQCSHCNAKSSTKSNLAKHIRTYISEKLYRCSYCNKKFAHKSSLTAHTKRHIGQKP